MCVYKIFILLVFTRECMERNVMTSCRILSSFECFLCYFQTRITTTKFLKFSNLHSLNLNNLQRSRRYCLQRYMFFFCIKKTNASVLNIFICCFVCFFVIFCHMGWKMKSFLFPDNDFGTLAFLFTQSCLCVTFTSWSTTSFGMLLSRLFNRKTHVCTSSIRVISFLYPLVWIVHKLQCFK